MAPKNLSRRAVALAITGGFAALHAPALLAQDVWPSKPVKLIIPFPAGGATDTLGRVLAQAMAADIGQPVVVENRLGAAGAIGSEAVAKSAPDGYTLLLATSSTHSIAPHLARLPFDPIAEAMANIQRINELAAAKARIAQNSGLGPKPCCSRPASDPTA